MSEQVEDEARFSFFNGNVGAESLTGRVMLFHAFETLIRVPNGSVQFVTVMSLPILAKRCTHKHVILKVKKGAEHVEGHTHLIGITGAHGIVVELIPFTPDRAQD